MDTYRALLMTDIVDSTHISVQVGSDGAARLWKFHDELVNTLLLRNDGLQIERTDGVVAVFRETSAALDFAFEYHRALSSSEFHLAARAAIEAGQLSLRESSAEAVALGSKHFEVDSLAKAVAARLIAITSGGQTLLTADAVASLGDTRLRVRTHGHWQLKGLPHPIEVFEIGEPHAKFTPPRDDVKAHRVVRARDLWIPAREVPHTLPAERDVFVGREDALSQIEQMIAAGSRLISVTGLGGTGKTRLVLRFAWRWLADYQGGIWFCDLSQARNADGIYLAMARGLGVSLNDADPLTQIANALVGRGQCLVLLDNFEQVADLAEETLGHWLDHAPSAVFIATTRETLRIVGEETLFLAPMTIDEGTALFFRRAVSAWQTYSPSAQELRTIDELVRQLDGLPLALELAAARVRVLPPRILLARLYERFDLLSSSSRRPGRQATLRAAFDWSWELLSEVEKRTLADLSVFEGGFSVQSADAVIALPKSAGVACEDIIESLLAKSLIQQVGERRFTLLETVRQYAEEQLTQDTRISSGGLHPLEDACQKHWLYFSRLGHSASELYDAEETNNMVSACRRAIVAKETEAMIGCLTGAWALLRSTGPVRAAAELAHEVLANVSLSDSDRALAHWVRGSALELMGDAESARQHFMDGHRSAESAGDIACQARLSMALGARQTIDGDLEVAYGNLATADRLAGDAGQPHLRAQILNSIGRLMDHQSRIAEARSAYEEGLALARQVGDRRLEGGLLANLGGLHYDMGQMEQARAHYDLALALARESGNRQWEGTAQCNLGLISQEQGRLDDAREQFESALKVAREMGHATLEYTVLCNLGILLEAEHWLDKATEYFELAVESAKRSNDRRSEGQFLGYLAITYAKLDRMKEARDRLKEGERLLLGVSDQLSYAILKCQHADIEHMNGRLDNARSAYAVASNIASSLEAGERSDLGRRLTALRSKVSEEPPRIND